MLMIRVAVALGLLFFAAAGPARADDAPAAAPATCTITGTNILTPDQAELSIGCSGMSEAEGKQLAEILNRILQDHLDPNRVLAKLDEIDRIPEEGVARTVDENQRQLIIKSLFGKPPGNVTITAHPLVEDSAELAKGIATALLQVGWQIAGDQIQRAAPKSLDAVPGVAVVVHDKNAPPQQALLLKAALTAARIPTALLADTVVAPDATRLWIGRRPQ